MTKAEVPLSFTCVASRFPNNSCHDISRLFQHIFSDSEIARQFKMDRSKLMYIDNFGLGSYFKELLYSKIKAANCFALLCDESFNKLLSCVT